MPGLEESFWRSSNFWKGDLAFVLILSIIPPCWLAPLGAGTVHRPGDGAGRGFLARLPHALRATPWAVVAKPLMAVPAVTGLWLERDF